MRCKAAISNRPHRAPGAESRNVAILSLASRLFALALVVPLACGPVNAVPAGTVVSNTASLSFEVNGSGGAVTSNTVSIVLAEVLDVTVVADAPSKPVGGVETVIGFRVANTGNGPEAFALAAAATGTGASIARIAVDADDNGVYDPNLDTLLASPLLALDPGQGKRLFVVAAGSQATDVSLTATAETGSGAAGTLLAGLGQGSGEAIVGQSGARASAHTLLTSGAGQTASLVKSQRVLAPDGTARAVQGATITYTLEAVFGGSVAGVEIADPIPVGTTYVAGSLRLDEAPLSDAADADPGRFSGSAIQVALGDVASPDTRTIRFQVIIQ